MPLRRLLLVLLAACAAAAQAATFQGVVTHVTDGDTLWVRPDRETESVEIRLADIDAPEGCQPFGPQAKRALAQRVLRQRVVVRTRGRDDYDRVVAHVRHRNQDINGWLVREGHAWATDYRRKPGAYERQEDQARAARRGLWSGPGPVEPRTFRRRHGRCA